MEFLDNLALGFGVALSLQNLAYCFLGVLLGTLIGVLPGVGPLVTISMLLPITYGLSPVSSVIMLAGIYYGAQYGGSTTAILVNLPGTSSAVTCLDGYQMARQGRAGAALGMAAIGSFLAGTLAVVGLMLVAPTLARFAIKFGPAEYFSLMVLGLSILAYLSHGSLVKAVIMAAAGLILGLVGLDSITAIPRLTFDRMELVDGLGLVPIVMGLFGVAEILANLEQELKREIFARRITGLMPTRDDWRRSAWPLARGSVLGFILGILPGGGAVISSFLSYGLEKRLSKTPERFGKGAIEGRGRAGGGQQRRGRRRLHPADDAGYPAQCRDGPADGRLHRPRPAAGAAADGAEARHLLGHRRQHVYRQHHAADPQPAADRHVGAAAEGALSHPLPLILLFCVIGVYTASGPSSTST